MEQAQYRLVSLPLPQTQRSHGPESIFRVERMIGTSSDESAALMLRKKLQRNGLSQLGMRVICSYTGRFPWWDGASLLEGNVPKRLR